MAFFNPENQPWRLLGRMVDWVGLSLSAVFCSLGIVTALPALSALYSSVVKAFRYGDNTPFRTYFKSFRENFKDGLVLSLFILPFILFFIYAYALMKDNSSSRSGAFLFTFYYVLLFIPTGTLLNLIPLLSRFKMSRIEYIKMAFTFTIAHLPSTFIIVLFSIELTVFTLQYWAACFFTPSLWALFSSFFLERNYKKHLNDDEKAKLEGLTLDEYLQKEKEREEIKNRFKRKK